MGGRSKVKTMSYCPHKDNDKVEDGYPPKGCPFTFFRECTRCIGCDNCPDNEEVEENNDLPDDEREELPGLRG
jgi:hypothetical protein